LGKRLAAPGAPADRSGVFRRGRGGGASIFAAMNTRRHRPSPLPSFGPRRISCRQDSAQLVLDEAFASDERPLQAELRLLERFSALMAAQGWPAHVSRMAYDRIYAGERFGFAKRVGRGELPQLARQLLERWRASRCLPQQG
jgi:hypothetical protein